MLDTAGTRKAILQHDAIKLTDAAQRAATVLPLIAKLRRRFAAGCIEMEIVRETGSHFDLDGASARRLMDDILARPLFAHLATASQQGPRESPVWFIWEDEALWIIGNHETDSFPARIASEPRCAIGLVDFDTASGLVQHVGFRGRARLEPHDADRMKRLFSRYMGEPKQWDSRFVKLLDDPDYIFVRFEPETVVVRDQSYKLCRNDRS